MGKLVIDRKVWLRGEPNSTLLRSDGKRCCVGIYLASLGVCDAAVSAASYASQVERLPDEALWLVAYCRANSSIATDLYFVNDSLNLAEPEREASVAARFGKHGVEVEFIN